MDILDELTQEAIAPSVDRMLSDDVVRTFEGNVGDVCFYDVVDEKFQLASLTDSTKYDASLVNDWKSIVLGVALNQEDGTGRFDILMAGFLMASPLEIPFEYHLPERKPYIRAYAYKMFQRFVSAFFRQCPGYEALLNLDISLPTVSDMLKIQKFSGEMFSSLKAVSEPDKYAQFIRRLFQNYIYVRHSNKKIYQMKISENPEGKPDVRVPEAFISADFICVFRNVDIYGDFFRNASAAENETDSDNELFFQ